MAKSKQKKIIPTKKRKQSSLKMKVAEQLSEYRPIPQLSVSEKNTTLLDKNDSQELLSVPEAAEWASSHLSKNVTSSNISYLIQYGRIKKIGENGFTQVSKKELTEYYKSFHGRRQVSWKDQLGTDLNWALSFDQYTEAETTKHVHRLHPYKGKFIPQLVEYFLDSHTDKFKKAVYFHTGDIILDPFCGSGTTLVQANELGMHAVGVDVSTFNALISNCKVTKFDLIDVQKEINRITHALKAFLTNSHTVEFEEKLLQKLYKFNNEFFPVPEYKYKVKRDEIDEEFYGPEKAREFLPIFQNLVKEYIIKIRQDKEDTFLDKWYSPHVRDEINFIFNEIRKIKIAETKKIITIMLSRTIRSCRATTHADLATLLEPVTTTYYCAKHGKICKPLFSILKWWETYTKDTIIRLVDFGKIRTETFQYCLTGDSQNINIVKQIEERNPEFAALIKKQKIRGIFSSPPYVGLIDYHEQHAYAYDLFGFKRQDKLEIGRMEDGQGKEAKENYAKAIAEVLKNSKHFLAKDYDVFLVANDKWNLYPDIAEQAGMKIVNQYKRPVLNRTEKDKGAYSEIIFHMRNKS
jgi:hypothetical protein